LICIYKEIINNHRRSYVDSHLIYYLYLNNIMLVNRNTIFFFFSNVHKSIYLKHVLYYNVYLKLFTQVPTCNAAVSINIVTSYSCWYQYIWQQFKCVSDVDLYLPQFYNYNVIMVSDGFMFFFFDKNI